jgi:hypothetical protein
MLFVKVRKVLHSIEFTSSLHPAFDLTRLRLLSSLFTFQGPSPSTLPFNWLCFGVASLEAAFIYYHAAFFLSTTFFIFFWCLSLILWRTSSLSFALVAVRRDAASIL